MGVGKEGWGKEGYYLCVVNKMQKKAVVIVDV